MTRPTETYKLLITKGEFHRLARALEKGLTRLNLPTDTRRECKEVAGLMHGVWFEEAYLRGRRGFAEAAIALCAREIEKSLWIIAREVRGQEHLLTPDERWLIRRGATPIFERGWSL